MSDARLRALQAGAARHEPGAGAALLAERLRIGELPHDRAALAALLGDDDACAALGVGPSERPIDVQDLEAYGREVVERACVATIRLLLPCWTDALPGDGRVPSAVALARSLLHVRPDARPEALWIERLRTAEHDAARVLPGGYESGPALAAVAVDYALAGILHGNMGCAVVAGHAHRALARTLGGDEDRARRLVHEAIAADLVPWLLGDPARERLEGRPGA